MPQVAFEFGPTGGTYEFESIDDARQWVEKVRSSWDWLNGNFSQATYRARELIHGELSQTIGILQQASGYLQQGNDAWRPQIQQAANRLNPFVAKNNWILAETAKNKFLQGIRQSRGDSIAAHIVAHWLNCDLSNISPSIVLPAIIEAELYERGSEGRITAETTAINELIERLHGDAHAYRHSREFDNAESSSLIESSKQAEAARSQEFSDLQKKRSDEWSNALAKANQELANVKDAYDKHMALAAPVTYWESKQQKHFKWMWMSGSVSALGMLIAGWLLHCELARVAAAASTTTIGAQQTGVVAVLSALTTWRLGSFILLTTLAFWVLRLIVRIFLSNMHLENDAAERVTMAKTYLALIRDGKLSGDSENLKAILAALFRPTGDGIVKDEGAPANMLEFLTKLGAK